MSAPSNVSKPTLTSIPLINADDDVKYSNGNDTINIIHFNDTYNINPQIKKDTDGNIVSIKGGASRIKSFINTLSPLKPIVLFSGDFLSPSCMSTATGGAHMIPVFNDFGITCSCLGNHELDRGNQHCIEMLSKLNYPTLNCNQLTPTNAKATGDVHHDLKLDLEPLGQCKRSFIYKYRHDFTIGFIGITGNWTGYIDAPENGLIYLDYIDECQKTVNEMKKKHQIDLMIALTHLGIKEDEILASKVHGIDVILGGHDHFYYCGMNATTNTMLLKSGYDFHNISWLQIQRNDNKDTFDLNELTKDIESLLIKSLNEKKGVFNGSKYKFMNRYYDVGMDIKPDESMEKLVHDLSNAFEEQVNEVVGYIAGPLDVRKCIVRTQESTAGNFIADVIRRAYHCDAVILNGGVLRADRIIPAGAITTKDILDIDAFQNTLMVIKATGSMIIDILEKILRRSCPQIAGIRFVYDDKAQFGYKIKKVWISGYKESNVHTFGQAFERLQSMDDLSKLSSLDDDDDLDLIEADTVYRIAIPYYVFNTVMAFQYEDVQVIVDHECGLPISVILRNFFWAMKTVNTLMNLSKNEDHKCGEIEEEKPKMGLSPCIEQRILTINQEMDMESDEFGASHGLLAKLPSFLRITRLPQKRTLLNILNEATK